MYLDTDLRNMIKSSAKAAKILKALAHEHRLLMLCFIGKEEKSVHEIETFLGISQSSVSQQLGKLKDKGIVSARRDGKNIYYSLRDKQATLFIESLHKIFCSS